jgi:hypothetical protein
MYSIFKDKIYMFKRNLATIVIGGFICSNSFAAPLHLEKFFIKNNVTKSSLVSNNHNQSAQSKFSGTWAGECINNGQSQGMKVRVNEDEYGLSIIDLLNEGDDENYSFNLVGSENSSDNKWYNSSTHRLIRVNENTLKLDGVDVDAQQLSLADTGKGFTSSVYTLMFTVNNNQLTMNMNGTAFYENKTASIDGKCTFKRVE